MIVYGLTFLVVLLIVYFFANLRKVEEPDLVEIDTFSKPDVEALRDSFASVPAPPAIEIIAPAAAHENIPDMAQFQTAYDIVRKHEGGFQKMPEDSGNYNSLRQLVGTNYGINAQVYENYLKRPPTEQDMRAMPRHIALAIFKQLYWDRIKGDDIRDQQVANILFDGHVNHGRWGIQMMQGVLGLSRDGIIGSMTLNAINRANPFNLFAVYKKARIAGYHDLVRRRPKDQRFLRGWLIRINSFIYQGDGLVFPPAGGGQGTGTAPAGGDSSGGVVAMVVAIAVAAYLYS
jgi:lysozyme family protein